MRRARARRLGYALEDIDDGFARLAQGAEPHDREPRGVRAKFLTSFQAHRSLRSNPTQNNDDFGGLPAGPRPSTSGTVLTSPFGPTRRMGDGRVCISAFGPLCDAHIARWHAWSSTSVERPLFVISKNVVLPQASYFRGLAGHAGAPRAARDGVLATFKKSIKWWSERTSA